MPDSKMVAARVGLLGLLDVQAIVGYEWLMSGLTKIARGGFSGGLSAELSRLPRRLARAAQGEGLTSSERHRRRQLDCLKLDAGHADTLLMIARAALVIVITMLLAPSAGAATGDADVAALQVGLRARGFYNGTIDGFSGPQTIGAVRRLEAASIAPTAVKSTSPAVSTSLADGRRLLGEYGRFRLGQRTLQPGLSGWDVAAFQFLLGWQGFPSGPMNGTFTERTGAAVRRFQLARGMPVDGIVGAATIAAVRAPAPPAALTFLAPLASLPQPSTLFGPRDDRFHTGIDYPATKGTPVMAAAAGRVAFAGWDSTGYGKLVILDHGAGLRSYYAHLSQITTIIGRPIAAGTVLGRVGNTGRSFGPHLHFEVRLLDGALDPSLSLLTTPSTPSAPPASTSRS